MEMPVETAVELFCHLDQHDRLASYEANIRSKTITDGLMALGGVKKIKEHPPASTYGHLG